MQFAIVALAAFLCFLVAHTDAWNWFNKHSVLDFDAIDRLLVENVPNGDISANMALIKETYEKKARESDSSFVKSLGKLVSLDTILSSERCDRKSYDLLQALDLGTGGKSRTWTPPRRIDYIVKYYTKEHAWICYHVFPRLVNATKISVSEENLKHVARMAEFVDKYFTTKDCELLEAPVEEKMFHHFPIHSVIKKLAAAGPDLKISNLSNEEKDVVEADVASVKVLYNKYFYEPCREFNDKVAEEYFDLIKYDFDFRYDVGYKSRCDNIYLDALAMNICHQVIYDKKFRKASLNFILKSRKKKTVLPN